MGAVIFDDSAKGAEGQLDTFTTVGTFNLVDSGGNWIGLLNGHREANPGSVSVAGFEAFETDNAIIVVDGIDEMGVWFGIGSLQYGLVFASEEAFGTMKAFILVNIDRICFSGMFNGCFSTLIQAGFAAGAQFRIDCILIILETFL